jgi:hypothetical protein
MLVLATALSLIANGQSAWSKPEAQWTAADATRILTDSPWTKSVAFMRGGGQVVAQFRWETARPVLAALAKLGHSTGQITGDGRVAVVSVRFPAHPEVAAAWQRSEASLEGTGDDPIAALGMEVFNSPDGVPVLAISFPRTTSLTTPKEIRVPFFRRNLKTLNVRLRLGPDRLSCPFPLREMEFQGAPEL